MWLYFYSTIKTENTKIKSWLSKTFDLTLAVVFTVALFKLYRLI